MGNLPGRFERYDVMLRRLWLAWLCFDVGASIQVL
jgi:hypothetical protein